MDWSLLRCARKGHVTYAPDEPGLRGRLSSPTAGGQAWRCLRCGAFVPGEPAAAGPASAAPRVRRGSELRSVLILRFFAVERIVRAVIVTVAAYAVWRFQYSRGSLQQAFNHELPRLQPFFKQFGYDLAQSKLVESIKHAFVLDPATLRWVAVGLALYAIVEIVEAVGLWMARRWGEYFAMIATSAGLPIEIYELAHKVTFLRAGAFALNVALVVYLVYAKRLLGVRGGAAAYEARLRSESIIDTEMAALAAAPAAGDGDGAAGPLASGAPGAATGAASAHGADGRDDQEPSGAPGLTAGAPGLTEATNSSAAE